LEPQLQNVLGPTELVESKVNKISKTANEGDEGATGEQIDLLELNMSDEELLELSDKWSANYALYYGKLKPRQEKNKKYYLGKQKENLSTDGTPIAGNLLFEAVETYLATALSHNPDPVVFGDNSQEGNKLADDVKTMEVYHSNVLNFSNNLALMTRQWLIYYLGVIKHGWDEDIKEIKEEIRRIQDFVFDPNGYVDVYGHFQGYLGERITVTADKLIEKFPKHKAYITIQVNGKMGTDCTYTEWWTDEYCFYTFKKVVLDKHKNEFFNYSENEQEEGQHNHFAKPRKPYTFLSVFSLQEQPHDITGLIEQNIANQNLISREINQIDYNISRSNNSRLYSEDNWTQQTAKQAAVAMQKGHPVLVPPGRPLAESVVDHPATPIPSSFFDNLQMNQDNLRSVFGTQGITAQKPNDNTTARGMMLNQSYDNARIGGCIGKALERVADNVFNWRLQLYYVYYDETHWGAVLGTLKAVEFITLSKQNLNKKLVISCVPDSLKPKDQMSEVNQAIQFFEMGAIGPKTLLTIADFPDPDESAADGTFYKADIMSYLQVNWPQLGQQIQAMQQQQIALQQQQAQMEMQQQQASGQQQLQQKGAAAQQGLQQKEAAHIQKLTHNEQVHAQKLKQASEKPNLSSVKLPK
jgi:hypothetical protein